MTPQTHPSRVLVFAATLMACSPAYASDYSGFLSGMTTVLVMLLAALNSLLTLIFALCKLYRSRKLAGWHATLASVPPVLGIIATCIDSSSINDEAIWFAVNGAALALALLPLFLAGRRDRA